MILSYFWAKSKIWKILPRWSQSAPKWHRKIWSAPKLFYWPIGLEMFHKWFWATFERKLKFENFCPGEVRVRQNDMEKLWRTKRFLLAHWFGNVPQIILSYFWAKTKIWKFCPGEVRVRQNDRKNYGVPKNVYWPIGLKMFHKWFWATFERKLKFEHFCPGEVIVRQKDIKKLWRTKRFLLAHWFGNVPQMILSYFWAKTKIWTFFPGEVRVRQNDIEKIMAYHTIFIGPLVCKCSTNDFELLLSEN